MGIDLIPDVVILRLPTYLRVLSQLSDEDIRVASSQKLGSLLDITPAQIRKDLSYFGRFGKQGRGYNVDFLRQTLRKILGLDKIWPSCLIGVGRLGQAIISYPGFSPEGFEIVEAFDGEPNLIGKNIGNLTIRPMADLPSIVKEQSILIGIVAVPSKQAQGVIDDLISSGIQGILNYAPVSPIVPEGIILRNVDPVISLQSMTYYIPKYSNRRPT